MKSVVWKIFSLFVLVLLIIPLFNSCEKIYSFDEIKEYVLHNYERLNRLVESAEGLKERKPIDINNYLGSKTIVEKVYYIEPVFNFYCGGTGIAPNSDTYGFYFSKEDTFFGMEFDHCKIEENTSSSRTYHSEDGVSFFYTKKYAIIGIIIIINGIESGHK